jgi:choline dehydrogenase-like flavoprotein
MAVVHGTVDALRSEARRRTLAGVCDTIVPPIERSEDPRGFWARAASDLGVPAAVEDALAQAPPDVQDGMRELLDRLAEDGFDDGSQEERERMLHEHSDSSPEALAGVHALKGLTTMLFYGAPDPETGCNPNWETIGYPGPGSPPPNVPKTLVVRRPTTEDLTLEADVCVVGSGCGGGVIAGELAERGLQVAVLEGGGYYNEADFNQLELWAYENLYLNGGPFTTAEGQVGIFAGATLGGGSTVNWMNCLRTRPWVREEWAREFGLEGLDGPDFDRHLDAVWETLRVNDRCSELNGPHSRLKEGCERFGYDFKLITRNADPERHDPEQAGYLGFGDQTGSKLGTLKTYLPRAQEHGTEIVVDCRAERVLVEGGRAAGVEATYADAEGHRARVAVRSPVVVVACGSIESPALLLRSGIGGPATGDYLRLHPTTAVFGVYGEDQRNWWGAPQAGLSDEFAAIDDGYGFLLECPAVGVGISATATPWHSGEQHKSQMSRFGHSASFISLVRDRGHGRVTIGPDGGAVSHYRLDNERDAENFRRGLATVVGLHEAAGAREIVTLSRKLPPWRRGEDLEQFVEAVLESSLDPYEHAIFSAHQMGSARMGSDPSTSVADPWGQLHDTPGVWVGDASAFPTASGTNPMITIMALARRTAEAIAADRPSTGP